MAELIFFSGTMGCGKSTLALQTDYNHASRGRSGLILTQLDRAGSSTLSSRLGITKAAMEVHAEVDIRQFVDDLLSQGHPVDYLICDEAQFYTPEQVDQLATIVDDLDIDVFTFGIATDFRTRLFPGAARLTELADRVETLQVTALCWCGRRATHNARIVGGEIQLEGDQVVVGDLDASEVAYEVLCRQHHRLGLTAQARPR